MSRVYINRMAGGGEGGKREAGAGPGSYITIVNHWGRSFYTNFAVDLAG